eukprot:8810788-Heterocapsa_arctica.AAC.1
MLAGRSSRQPDGAQCEGVEAFTMPAEAAKGKAALVVAPNVTNQTGSGSKPGYCSLGEVAGVRDASDLSEPTFENAKFGSYCSWAPGCAAAKGDFGFKVMTFADPAAKIKKRSA